MSIWNRMARSSFTGHFAYFSQPPPPSPPSHPHHVCRDFSGHSGSQSGSFSCPPFSIRSLYGQEDGGDGGVQIILTWGGMTSSLYSSLLGEKLTKNRTWYCIARCVSLSIQTINRGYAHCTLCTTELKSTVRRCGKNFLGKFELLHILIIYLFKK